MPSNLQRKSVQQEQKKKMKLGKKYFIAANINFYLIIS